MKRDLYKLRKKVEYKALIEFKINMKKKGKDSIELPF